jgi:hypothetical protein
MPLQTKKVLIFGFILALSSCAENTSSNEDSKIDDGGLETPSVYVRDIQPIFNASCATSGCHASSSATSGIKMSSYSEVMASVGNVLGKLVVTNDASNSSIVKVIEGTTNSVARMPFGGSALSSADITKIKDWINDGAKN